LRARLNGLRGLLLLLWWRLLLGLRLRLNLSETLSPLVAVVPVLGFWAAIIAGVAAPTFGTALTAIVAAKGLRAAIIAGVAASAFGTALTAIVAAKGLRAAVSTGIATPVFRAGISVLFTFLLAFVLILALIILVGRLLLASVGSSLGQFEPRSGRRLCGGSGCKRQGRRGQGKSGCQCSPGGAVGISGVHAVLVGIIAVTATELNLCGCLMAYLMAHRGKRWCVQIVPSEETSQVPEP